MKNDLSTGELILRKTLPVIINVFNQYTYLKNLIDKLSEDGFVNFIILDNASTYPPLLNYYGTIGKSYKAIIIHYGENRGPHFFHMKGLYKTFGSLPHLYTDPDVSYDILADNFVTELMIASEKYSMFKVGPALELPADNEIDNDMYCIQSGKRYSIKEWEAQFWTDQVELGYFYPGRIDTTFQLFNPKYFEIGTALIDGIRLAKPGFIFKHLPWYRDKKVPDAEWRYYRNHSSSKASWCA
jgi:hypothetical protein